MNKNVLKSIQEAIEANRIKMTDDEAIMLWPKIKSFSVTNEREPSMNSDDSIERRLAEALIYIRHQRRIRGL